MTFDKLITQTEIEAKECAFLASIYNDVEILLDYPNLGGEMFFTGEGKLLFDFYKYCCEHSTSPSEMVYGTFLAEDAFRKENYMKYSIHIFHSTIKDFALGTSFEHTYLDWTKLRILKRLAEEGYTLKADWKKCSIEDIYADLDTKVQDIFLNMASEVKVSDMVMDDNFIADLDEGAEAGMSYASAFPYLNHLTNGLHYGDIMMVGGFINTGKSTFALNLLIGALTDNPQESGLLIANEMDKKAYLIQALSLVLFTRFGIKDLGRRQLKNGGFDQEAMNAINQAREFWNVHIAPRIHFVKTYNYDMRVVGRLMKRYQKVYGANIVVLDTLKADVAGEWQDLVQNSKQFYQLCSKLGMAGMATVQMKMASSDNRIITMADTGGAKDILQVAGEAFYLRPAYADELDGGKLHCNPVTRTYDSATNSWRSEAINIDLRYHKQYLIGFHVKGRNAETGSQLFFKFYGKFGFVQEMGTCTVTEKRF